ncbi:hypothetical protein C8J56DRAFT_872681 [Mycena floridula]|nr:hypothetical protein C8J56DRAFT_872681 [Mycena floridula]
MIMVSPLLSLLFLAAVCSAQLHQSRASHESLAHRVASNSTFTNIKRDSDTFSWWEVGLGACGGTNKPTEFVVSLSAQNWDGGAHCYKEITIQYNGRSAQAQIVDECMACPWNGLDFSHSLFSHFVSPDTPENVGIIYGSWSYGSNSDDSDDSDKVTTKKAVVTTKHPSTTVQPTSTHTSTSISTTALAESSSRSASPTGASASATAAVDTQAIDVNNAFSGLAQIVVAFNVNKA